MAKSDTDTHTVTKSSTKASPNLRHALAGLGYLQGLSAKKALTSAGFSPSTAANPNYNGVGPDRCISAAVETFPEVNTANLVQKTRRALNAKLDCLFDKQGQPTDQLRKANLSHLARFSEVIEKNYGATGDSIDDGRAFGARLAWLAEVSREMRERGMDPDGTPQDRVVLSQSHGSEVMHKSTPPLESAENTEDAE